METTLNELQTHRRLMKEVMNVALDVKARMPGIEAAMKEKPKLFDRNLVKGMKEFGDEGLRQRGGGVTAPPTANNIDVVAEEFESAASRVDNLCRKLRRGHFARNALVLAGLSIRGGGDD